MEEKICARQGIYVMPRSKTAWYILGGGRD
jgi:hypothetical protein